MSLSSTKEEYKELCGSTYEVVWLTRVLEYVEEKQEGPTVIKCENQSSIKLANNPMYHARSKDIETNHHFVREKFQSKEINLIYCNINENVADMFTKPIGKAKLEMFRSMLGVVVNPFVN